MKALVVANCNGEDVRWATQLGRDWWVYLTLLQRPPGREASAYLDFLVSSDSVHPSAFSEIVFCQGNPFNHGDPLFLEHLQGDDKTIPLGGIHECDGSGLPEQPNTPVDEWCKVLGLPVQKIYRFVAGAHYRVTPEQIRSRSPTFYRVLYLLSLIPETRAACVLERLWPLIWGIEL